MNQYKFGDRVKYIGPYINQTAPRVNPQGDLVPGYLGTVIDVDTNAGVPWPIRVRFDKHGTQVTWPMNLSEIEPVQTPVRITNYNEAYGLTDDYRARVLKAAEETSVKEAAAKFNLSISTIYYWRKAVQEFTNA